MILTNLGSNSCFMGLIVKQISLYVLFPYPRNKFEHMYSLPKTSPFMFKSHFKNLSITPNDHDSNPFQGSGKPWLNFIFFEFSNFSKYMKRGKRL